MNGGEIGKKNVRNNFGQQKYPAEKQIEHIISA